MSAEEEKVPQDEEAESNFSYESDSMQIHENHMVDINASRARYNPVQPNIQGGVRYKSLTEKYTHEECMPPPRYVQEGN